MAEGASRWPQREESHGGRAVSLPSRHKVGSEAGMTGGGCVTLKDLKHPMVPGTSSVSSSISKTDRKSTRLNSSPIQTSRMPYSA